MPIQKCIKENKSGYKFGKSGYCYTGSDAREKALQQARAIEASKSKRNK